MRTRRCLNNLNLMSDSICLTYEKEDFGREFFLPKTHIWPRFGYVKPVTLSSWFIYCIAVVLYDSRWFLTFIWNEMWIYFDHCERPVDCFVCPIKVVSKFVALTFRKWWEQLKTQANPQMTRDLWPLSLKYSHTWWAQKQREGNRPECCSRQLFLRWGFFLIAIKFSSVQTIPLFILHIFLGEGSDFIFVSKVLWVHVEYQCYAAWWEFSTSFKHAGIYWAANLLWSVCSVMRCCWVLEFSDFLLSVTVNIVPVNRSCPSVATLWGPGFFLWQCFLRKLLLPVH